MDAMVVRPAQYGLITRQQLDQIFSLLAMIY